VRIASFIIGLLGAAGALLLGGKWQKDMSSPEAAAALELAKALAKEGGGGALGGLGAEALGLQRATYALLACGAIGLIVSIIVLIRKGQRVANGAILVICGALPLVFQTKAIGDVLMVLAASSRSSPSRRRRSPRPRRSRDLAVTSPGGWSRRGFAHGEPRRRGRRRDRPAQGVQLPPTHVWPPVHWWPHVPQLSRSLLRLVSQPLAAKLSQSPNPGLQLKPHVLATHFAPVTLLPVDGQLLAQLPQWLAVLVRLVSQPLFAAPSQSSKLGLHMKPQAPVVHFAPATLAPVDGQT